MASRKRRESQKGSPSKPASNSRKKIRSASIVRAHRRRANTRSRKGRVTRFNKLPNHSAETRTRAIHVLADMRRNPKLTFSQAAANREVSARSIHKYISSQLKQDRPGGRIRVTKSDRLKQTMQIPTTSPTELTAIKTTNSVERQLVGEWQAGINEAKKGDYTRIHTFPKGTIVNGVRLPTSDKEVQRIVEVLESEDSVFEQLYAVGGAR